MKKKTKVIHVPMTYIFLIFFFLCDPLSLLFIHPMCFSLQAIKSDWNVLPYACLPVV